MNECEIYTAWSIIGFLIVVIILRVDDNLRLMTMNGSWTIRNFLEIKFLNPKKIAILLLIFSGPLVWVVILIEMLIDYIFSNLD